MTMLRCWGLTIPQRFHFFVKALLPGLLVIYALADEGREHSEMQEQPVEETLGLPQRLGEIDEQHYARVRRAVQASCS